MKQSTLHSWFAVLLLVFASADLSADLVSPQSCCEWIDNLAISSAPQMLSSAPVTRPESALTAADNSHPEPASNPSDAGEDCFCCCAHILPVAPFDVAILYTKPPASMLTNTRLPSAPSQTRFRPPRLA